MDDETSCVGQIPRLLGDSRRIKQVLINLIRNAMKFTKQGSVEVHASYSTDIDSHDRLL